MGLFNKNTQGGVMDMIRCDQKDYLIWKWRPEGAELGESSRENAIRWGSSLNVKQGSVAAFVYSGKEGAVQDFIEGPANTIVNTKNLPVIASLIGSAYNGGTPFPAEVYYINLAETIQTRFAVPYFDVFDSELREFSVPVCMRGTIDFNISDYRQFVKCHRLDDFSISELQNQVRDAVQERMKDLVMNAPAQFNIPVIQIESKAIAVKEAALNALKGKFYDDYGVNLKDILIAGLEIDKSSEGYKVLQSVTKDLRADTLRAKSRAAVRDIEANQKLGVFGKAASMFVDIREGAYARRKKTQSENVEAYELEVGGKEAAVASKLASVLKRKGQKSEPNGASVPPPIPSVSYHVVMYGKAAGPYNLPTLKEMVQNGSLTVKSMVWKEGMADWTEAGKVDELSTLFHDTGDSGELPPLPGGGM